LAVLSLKFAFYLKNMPVSGIWLCAIDTLGWE
jgi:hypothetical protein